MARLSPRRPTQRGSAARPWPQLPVDPVEQLVDRGFQGTGELNQGRQSGLAQAALQEADFAAVEIRGDRQLFLGEVGLLAQGDEVAGEAFGDLSLRAGHQRSAISSLARKAAASGSGTESAPDSIPTMRRS